MFRLKNRRARRVTFPLPPRRHPHIRRPEHRPVDDNYPTIDGEERLSHFSGLVNRRPSLAKIVDEADIIDDGFPA
jgi:hypothetical protein|tara:strand:- start:324 stop:548 length:225 start_codon:yes stop_codon:yes gene_type:complete